MIISEGRTQDVGCQRVIDLMVPIEKHPIQLGSVLGALRGPPYLFKDREADWVMMLQPAG